MKIGIGSQIGSIRQQWFPSNPREEALDRITQRVFDCHWDQLDREWTQQAILRRYDSGERE